MTPTKIFAVLLLFVQLVHCQWYGDPYSVPNSYNPYNQYNAYNPYYSQGYSYGGVSPWCGGQGYGTEAYEVPNNGNQPNIIVINDGNDAAVKAFEWQELLTLLFANGFGRNAVPAPAPIGGGFGGYGGNCGCCCKPSCSCYNCGCNCNQPACNYCNSEAGYCNSGDSNCNSGPGCCNSGSSCYSGANYCGTDCNLCNSDNACYNNGNILCENNNDLCSGNNKINGFTTHVTIVLPSNLILCNKNEQ